MLNASLILIFAMSIIQYGAALAKDLFPLVGVAGAASYRLFFASLMLLLIFRPWRKKITGSDWKNVLLYGSSLGIMNLTFYFALERIPLGIAVALEFTGPLGVALFSSTRKLDYLWAVLAGMGIFLLFPVGFGSTNLDPFGVFFALFAGLCWALYIIFGKRAGAGLSGGHAISLGMLMAALIVLPFGLIIEGKNIFNRSALPIGIAVALFGSAIPYTLEMFALKKMASKTFGVLMSLEPALASVMGLLFLGEHLTVLQWSAIFCVIFSSVGSSIKK